MKSANSARCVRDKQSHRQKELENQENGSKRRNDALVSGKTNKVNSNDHANIVKSKQTKNAVHNHLSYMSIFFAYSTHFKAVCKNAKKIRRKSIFLHNCMLTTLETIPWKKCCDPWILHIPVYSDGRWFNEIEIHYELNIEHHGVVFANQWTKVLCSDTFAGMHLHWQLRQLRTDPITVRFCVTFEC